MSAQQRPRVIAHRGASAVEPEHTLRAYLRAIEMGADGVECDVRLTRDGVAVCIHDRTVSRTSNGSGVVSTLTLADMHRLDFGSWFAAAERVAPAEVLTLELLIETVVAAGRPMEIAIETKHPTRYGGRVEREVVALLERFGLRRARGDGVVTARVMSFSSQALAAVRRMAPELPTVQLMRRVPANRREATLWSAATVAGPSLAAVKAAPAFVERVRARGHEVYVWTVDGDADVAYVAGLGVEGIITNRPDRAIAALER